MRFKYVIFPSPDGIEPEVPVIFPTFVLHKAIAASLAPSLGIPVSAGFVTFAKDGSLWAGGESIGLRLRSRSEDISLIRDLGGIG